MITTDPIDDLGDKLGAVYWWERQPGGGWAEHSVSGDFYGATWADATDIDLHGDLDVYAAAYYGDGPELGRNGKFAWFENLDGALKVAVSSEDLSPSENAQVLLYETSTFGAAGQLSSATLDGGLQPDWRDLTWDADVPPSTALTLSVRASDDPGDLGPYVPVPRSGTDLGPLIDADARYLQYRVDLSSSDPSRSPVLREVAVDRGADW